MVADAAARPAGRVRLAVPHDVGVRGLAGAARRSRRAGERSGDRGLRRREAYWSAEWAHFEGADALADQVRFEREWTALREYARERGVRLIGDVPIFVSDVGADHPGWPELFAHGEVAGAPPDALSANGQLWGNPLYDWPAHRATGFRWWIERFRRTFEHVDMARVDHFRGFVAYWAVPRGPQDGAARSLAARARRRALPRGRGRARRPAADRRGPRRDHAAGRTACATSSASRAWWCSTSPSAAAREPAPAREPSGERGRVHGHARHGHGGRLVRRAEPRQRAATGLDPAEPNWGLIPRLRSRARLAIVPARTCSASAPRRA